MGAVIAVVAMLSVVLATAPVLSPASAATNADAWTIDTVAGAGGTECESDCGDGGPATAAPLRRANGVGIDAAGNLYIAETARVRRVDTEGIITTVAGTGEPGFSGDGGPATSAQLHIAIDVVVDADGNLYISDFLNARVRKVDPAGIITTVVGTGTRGYSGDGGPATQAQISYAGGLAVDPAGNLYLADTYNHRIRMVDSEGIITTVAGTGEAGFSGDGGPATAAQFNQPGNPTFDASGALYIADYYNRRIRMVDTGGIITTVAGGGDAVGSDADGGPATSASLTGPTGLALQESGIMFITEGSRHAIRRVDAAGTIDTITNGTGFEGFYGDGGYAPFAALYYPRGLGLDANDNLYIADQYNNRVRRIATSHLWVSAFPDPTRVGETFTYRLSLSGLPATATGVTLTTEQPAEVSFVDVTASQGSCANSGGTVSCQLGTVGVGGTATVQITADAVGAGVVPITATVGADDPEAVPGHRTVTAYTKISAADCGQTITESTVLTADLGPCVGNGIIVGANDVTLDLGGHRVFGFPYPGDGSEAGIRLPQRSGVTVTNGTVSDFDAGVVLYGGRANTLTALTVRDNVGPDNVFLSELGDGIFLFDSAANAITGNTVVGNGVFDGIGVWGSLSDRNIVEGNTVTGSIGPSDRGPAGNGIIINGADERLGIITGTVVSANTVRGSGAAGIANINNIGGNVEGNIVEDNGFTNRFGNGIGVQVGVGSRSQDSRLTVKGNQIHGNAESGIRVISGRNTIVDNDASDNALAPKYRTPAFDLEDRNPDCGTNTWSGNVWGSGGFSPACTTTGGSGPTVEGSGDSLSASSAPPEEQAPTLTRLYPPIDGG